MTNPLNQLHSIKVRLGIIIVAGVAMAVGVASLGRGVGWSWLLSAALAGALGLSVVQILARGTTARLRDMAAATDALAAGDYGRRVEASGNDEVGQLARAFNAMADQLASVDQFRRDLVANASHELRTPITAMQAILENLVDGVAQPDAPTIQLLHDQTVRLGRLVHQLLDLSRLEAGTVPFDVTNFAIEPVLEDVARLATPAAAAKGVALSVEVLEDPRVRGDAERVHQVVTNLVDNAVRHAPATSIVTLHADTRGPSVQLCVCDDGPGVSAADAARIFDRFYRSDPSRPANDGGAGLGLSIAKWIVDLHGGTIRSETNAHSASGHGCRMIVTLPAAGVAPIPKESIHGR